MNTAITITDLGIARKSGYGQYQVSGYVNGTLVKAHTTNSEAYDWFNDDSDAEKHAEAVNYCHYLIEKTYNDKY